VGADLFHANGQREGRTNRYDETTSRFSQFFEHAWKGKTVKKIGKVDNNIKNIFKEIFCE
jgi:hypothetical protein